MESSDVVQTGGIFNSCDTSNIATFSISAAISSNDPEKSASVFFRAKTLSLRLMSNLFFLLFLLTFLRFFRLSYELDVELDELWWTMVNAWQELDVYRSRWQKLIKWLFVLGCFLFHRTANFTVICQQEKLVPFHEVVCLSKSATNNHLIKVHLLCMSTGGAKFIK